MDKNFMPVHTHQYNQILSIIKDSLGVDPWYVGKQASLQHETYDITTVAGPITVDIRRWLNYEPLKTDIEINLDHEVIIKTVIKSDAELDRILQIIRCLNPERLASGITACDL